MNPQKLFRNIAYLLAGCFLLVIPFGMNENMINPVVNGKIFWFESMMLIMGIAVILFELIERKACLHLLLPDWMVLGMAAVMLLTYDWHLNPDPTHLYYYLLICIWWFLLRIIASKEPLLTSLYLLFIFLGGAVQAIWGLVQIYNLADSNHMLFRVTGFFSNPGPYSGYLAMLLPVALGLALHLRKLKGARNISYRFVRGVAWVTCLLILMVLPSGMSRSAWLAALISSVWVIWEYRFGIRKIKILSRRKPILVFSVLFLTAVLFVAVVSGLYIFKKDSADGRLLMWKVTSHAMWKNPVKGTGIGGFPAAFAEAQAAYLDSPHATDREKLIAGCPETAFNEYLHIWTELGIFGFLFFIVACGSIIYIGIRKKRYYVIGGLISLLIFAFSSYPFHEPSFLPIAVVLGVIAVNNLRVREVTNRTYSLLIILTGILLAAITIGITWQERERLSRYTDWPAAKVLYSNKAFQVAAEKYAFLEKDLFSDPDYLFEYAQCLSECGENQKAIPFLERAVRLSSDPMMHYMIGKNKMKINDFEGAETSLLYGLKILPERIYPYFLLTELYSHPENYSREKLVVAVDSVLYKTPKVESTAIQEMRRKVNKLLLHTEK